MSRDEEELQQERWRRMRRVKRWLRLLPRRSNIHRYPVLRFFAQAAKKRVYIWSFREETAIPAIYAGCILTLLPIYGTQIAIALALALLLRANLPILVGLQVVSNPITVLPLWFANYQIGRAVLAVLGVEALPLQRGEVRQLLGHFVHGRWNENFDRMISVFGVTSLGAIVMGTFFGLIGSISYRIVARRTASSYSILKNKINRTKQGKIS